MKRILIPALAVVVAVSSCKKDATGSLEGSWLFPIAKGSMSLNSMKELKNLGYHVQVPAFSIGQPVGVPVSSPGLSQRHVGPFAVQITPWLHRIDIDSLEFSGTLTNFFPVPIGAGTKLAMRTSRDTSSNANIAGAALIATNVAPGAKFTFDISITDKSLGDSVYFFLEDFTSPAYNNVVFTNNATTMDITLKVITSYYVEAYTNKTFSCIDTSDFDPGGIDQASEATGGVTSDTAIKGYINVFLDNSMPANATFQLYFLDKSKTYITDSLFSKPIAIAGAITNAAGDPLNTISLQDKIPVTRRKIDLIKQSSFVVSSFHYNTNGYIGTYVSANKKPKLNIQFTGDINLRIKL